MSKLSRKFTGPGKSTARKTYDTVETKVMAAVGRKVVKNKVNDVKTVAKRAAKSALIAGGIAAVGVVATEIRNRRKPA